MKTKKTPARASGNLSFYLVFALTLGLAPFYPEPHILGKLRWVAGGARGMELLDWFDLAMHGFPWVMLIGSLIGAARKKLLAGR